MTSRVSREGTSNAHGNHSFPFACHASTFSCDEAIEYLSAAHEHANVGEDFVTDHRMGFGVGGSNRNRAAENVDTMLQEAEESIRHSTKALADATSKKARAYWHLALEKITCGQLDADSIPPEVSPSISMLWKLRSVVLEASKQEDGLADRLPALLLRGWRNSETFQADVFHKHPSFAWAYPYTYQLDAIPSTVTLDEVNSSIRHIFQDEDGDIDMIGTDADRITIVKISPNSENWDAIVQFASEDDLQVFRKKAGSTNGVALTSQNISPQLQESIDSAKDSLDEAEAEYKVCNGYTCY